MKKYIHLHKPNLPTSKQVQRIFSFVSCLVLLIGFNTKLSAQAKIVEIDPVLIHTCHDHSIETCNHSIETCNPTIQVEAKTKPVKIKSNIFHPDGSKKSVNACTSSTFEVTYTGFSAQAEVAFQFAVDIWEATLHSDVPIKIDAFWEPLLDENQNPDPTRLGSAGPIVLNLLSAPFVNTAYPVALSNKITGVDNATNDDDINARFNSFFPDWYFGTDANPAPNQIDFVTVVLHEIAHGLGYIGATADSSIYISQNNDIPFVWSQFIETGDGTPITTFPHNSADLSAALVSDDLFFNGPFTVLANNNMPAKIFAPDSLQLGSSYLHLDTPPNNILMQSGFRRGVAIHTITDYDIAPLYDMGWAPGPGTPVPVDICNDDNSTLNLADFLTSEDPCGTWTLNASSAPVTSGFDAANGTFTPLGNAGGSYIFDYTFRLGISSSVTVNVFEISSGTVAPLVTGCNTDGNTISLFLSLIGEDLGGTWSLNPASLVPASGFNAANGTFVPSGNAAGDYLFDYTVSDSRCTSDETTTIQITLDDCQIYDLALIMEEVSSGPYLPGHDVTYKISVSNQGSIEASNIELTNYIPTDMTLSVIDNNGWIGGSAGPVTNTISSIPAAQDVSVDIILRIDPNFSGTSIVSFAEISADDGDDLDSSPDAVNGNDAGGAPNTPSDNALFGNGTGSPGDGVAVTDEDDHDPALISVQGIPEISLTKTGTFNDENGDGCANVGETISYTFQVENTGNTVITNVTVVDPLVTVTGGPISLMLPAEVDGTTFSGTYILTQSDLNNESVENTAAVDGTVPGGNFISDFDTEDITLNVGSDIDQDGILSCNDTCPNDRDVSLNFEDRGGFAGNNSDFVEVQHDQSFNVTDGDFAFEAWVNPSSGGYKTIVSKGHGGNTSTQFIFGIMADNDQVFNQPGKLALFLSDGSLTEWGFSNTSIPQNTWTHVAVSVSNSGMGATFYINGMDDGLWLYSFVDPLYNGDTNSLFIGRQGYDCQCNHFDGRIDELAIWDEKLTFLNIAASMAAPYTGREPGLVAYYDFNNADACVTNTGNTVLTDLANGHNGNLTNFSLLTGCESNWTAGHNMGSCPVTPPCAQNLDLTNNQTANAIYESGGYISSDQTITSPAQVDYDAATMITLQQNFEVKPGAIFHAYINGCIAGTPQDYLDAGFSVLYLLSNGYTTQDLIGLNHNGGIIFYINPGNGTGLVAAPTDQSTAQWGCLGTNVPGANGTVIGTGAQNTIQIINAGCSSGTNAANLCTDLSLNGYNDWFLPSIDEVIQLYLNRAIIGGFSTGLYWSSSEDDMQGEDEKAFALSFGNGTSSTRRKNITISVRAIRAF